MDGEQERDGEQDRDGVHEKAAKKLPFPPEIQEEIVMQLKDYHDVENALVVFDPLPKRVGDWFQNMKEIQMPIKVFDILLGCNYLNPDEALGCRLVCKAWKGAVDKHYNTANIHSLTFPGRTEYFYPRASIVVPMDRGVSRKLRRYARHGANPFVGGRLMLRIAVPEGRILNQVEAQAVVASEGVQHVWDHVEHLEIYQEDELDDGDDDAWFMGMDGLTIVLRQILERLKNVKTVTFESKALGAEVLQFMPGLSALEQLAVLVDWDDDITEYGPILDICSGSLKLIRSKGYLAFCMNRIVQRNQFPQLEELWLAGPAERLLNRRAEAVNSLSNLRKIGLELQHTVEFYAQLVDVTFAFPKLDEIEINVVRDTMLRQIPRLSLAHLGDAREGFDKLSIIERSKFSKDEFNGIVENCRKLFPGLVKLCIVKFKKRNDDSCYVS